MKNDASVVLQVSKDDIVNSKTLSFKIELKDGTVQEININSEDIKTLEFKLVEKDSRPTMWNTEN